METYLVFFGKSQSFSFEAYDSSGYIDDFSKIVRDFDDLESRMVVVNRIDNKPVYAFYKLRFNNKEFTLLKVFICAQAFDGNRVEGSICGVAMLSEGILDINQENIKILQLLLKSFTDLALTGNKFKQANFKLQTDTIWKAFTEQISFSKINVLPQTKTDLSSSSIAIAIGLNKISDIFNALQQNSSLSYQQLYFSEDLELLQKSFLNWEDRLKLYLYDHQQLKLYAKNPRNQIRQESAKLDLSNDATRNKIFDLEVALKQQKKLFSEQISKSKGKIRLLTFILFSQLLFASAYFVYYAIRGDVMPLPPPPVTVVAKMEKIDYYIPSKIFSDTAKLKFTDSIFFLYMALLRNTDSIKYTKDKKLFFKKLKYANDFDSIEVDSYISKLKKLQKNGK